MLSFILLESMLVNLVLANLQLSNQVNSISNYCKYIS